MNQAAAPVIIIACFVAFIGFIGWLAARQSKLNAEGVRQIATTLGLQCDVQAPTLGIFHPEARAMGQWRGKQVAVYPFWTGSGRNRTRWTAVSAKVPVPGALTFRLRLQGVGTKLMELFGAREIQVGDPEFDRTWFIQTNQADVFRAALLPELREKIDALWKGSREPGQNTELKLEQNEVRYAEIGSFATAACRTRCLRAVEVVCDLADVAEVCAGQPPTSGSVT